MINLKEYTTGQSAHKDSDKKDYYKWAIWIENGESDISEIDYVEYLLHSTFKNRLRKATNLSDKFKIESSGWGEFNIEITVVKKNGERLQLSHWLTLGDGYESVNVKSEAPELKLSKVYISHSDADTRTAQQLEYMLTDLGMDVVSASDVDPGNSIEDYIIDSITSSDAVITINSENESDWQKAEIKIADKLSKKIIPLYSIIDEEEKKSSFSSRLDLDESYGNILKDLGGQINKLNF